MLEIRIQTEAIDAPKAQAANANERSGAVVVFSGQVRNDAKEAALSHLMLEHFPDVTEAEIARIANQAAQRWPVQKIQIIHRVGRINAGEEVVRVTTMAAHRRDAYEANAFIMDYLKTEAPFWKQECFADASAHWVAAKNSDQHSRIRWESNAQSSNGHRIGALILAGGQGSRMGGVNKGLQLLDGKPLVQHVAERLQPQVDYLAISANNDLPQYQGLGFEVFSDEESVQGKGPLAGIISAAAHIPAYLDALLIVPCDTPFIPHNLVARLSGALFQNAPPTQTQLNAEAHLAASAMAVTSDGPHPSICLVKPALLLKLFAHLQNTENLRLRAWLDSALCVSVHFDDAQAFTNLNDLPALKAVQTHL